MARSVRATYRDGVLEPSEDLDLDDGAVVVVTISGRRVTEEDLELMRSSFGAWKGKIDAEQLISEIYEARLTGSRNADELNAE